MTTARAGQVHARLARLGPFVGHDPLPVDAAAAGWRPCAGLLASGPWIEQLVACTREALALGGHLPQSEVEDRVAASTAHLSVLSRVISPAVSLTALGGRVPDLGAHLWLRLDDHRLQAALDYGGLAADVGCAQAEAALAGPLVRELLLPFGDLLGRTTGLASGIVLGNTASALRGAVTALLRTAPDLALVAEQLVDDVLALPELTDAWLLTSTRPATWRRRSCCLYYRLPGAGLCGDCALTRVPRR